MKLTFVAVIILGASIVVPIVVPIAVPSAFSATPAFALFTSQGGPVDPGAVPRGLSGLQPSDCATCHAEIAAEWASSRHASAWTQPVFQAEYRLSLDSFCRNCHAPLVPEATWARVSPSIRAGQSPAGTATGGTSPAAIGTGRSTRTATSDPGSALDLETYALAARGVDCAVCHVREGRILGARGHGEADHASRREAALATSAFCGGCHQFRFPAAEPGRKLRHHPEEPLQNTLAEWKQSRASTRPCQQCHMPQLPSAGSGSKPHKSHAFRVFDDPSLLANAVRIKAAARRLDATILATITISAGDIGHAFPTGDMFRRAILTVRTATTSQHTELRRYFGPTMTSDGRGHLLGQVDDTRIPPSGPPTRFRFSLPDATSTEITWTLELHRLDPADAISRGLSESTKALVQSGRIPVRR